MRLRFRHFKATVVLGSAALALLGTGWEITAEDKAAAKVKPYPLDTCVVADEKLGSMGEPYVFVHNGQELKLCCKGCLRSFNKEPAKYLKKLEAPAKKKE
ncbi:MAG: hypothetical protein ACK4UN_11405 [Limisphaerales bacterium]